MHLDKCIHYQHNHNKYIFHISSKSSIMLYFLKFTHLFFHKEDKEMERDTERQREGQKGC